MCGLSLASMLRNYFSGILVQPIIAKKIPFSPRREKPRVCTQWSWAGRSKHREERYPVATFSSNCIIVSDMYDGLGFKGGALQINCHFCE